LKNYDKIYLATDGDREGEAISENVLNELKLKNYERIIFYEVTENGIKNALKNPKKINKNLYEAQKARLVLDKIIGFSISPELKHFVNENNLSAGRVLSVVTKLIIEKENKINDQINNEQIKFYNFEGNFFYENLKLHCDYYEKNIKFQLKNKIKVQEKMNCFKNNDNEWKIFKIDNKMTFEYPQPPFTTSSIQQ